MLEESGHLGVVVYRALDRQEASVQFVDQTHVHNIAERKRKEEKQKNVMVVRLNVFVLTR